MKQFLKPGTPVYVRHFLGWIVERIPHVMATDAETSKTYTLPLLGECYRVRVDTRIDLGRDGFCQRVTIGQDWRYRSELIVPIFRDEMEVITIRSITNAMPEAARNVLINHFTGSHV